MKEVQFIQKWSRFYSYLHFIIFFKCSIFYHCETLKIAPLKYHLCSFSKRFMGAMLKMSTTFTALKIYVPRFKVSNNILQISNRLRSFNVQNVRVQKVQNTFDGTRCGLFCFFVFCVLKLMFTGLFLPVKLKTYKQRSR